MPSRICQLMLCNITDHAAKTAGSGLHLEMMQSFMGHEESLQPTIRRLCNKVKVSPVHGEAIAVAESAVGSKTVVVARDGGAHAIVARHSVQMLLMLR